MEKVEILRRNSLRFTENYHVLDKDQWDTFEKFGRKAEANKREHKQARTFARVLHLFWSFLVEIHLPLCSQLV